MSDRRTHRGAEVACPDVLGSDRIFLANGDGRSLWNRAVPGASPDARFDLVFQTKGLAGAGHRDVVQPARLAGVRESPFSLGGAYSPLASHCDPRGRHGRFQAPVTPIGPREPAPNRSFPPPPIANAELPSFPPDRATPAHRPEPGRRSSHRTPTVRPLSSFALPGNRSGQRDSTLPSSR